MEYLKDNLIKDALQPIKYVNRDGEIKELNPQELLTFNTNDLPFSTTANTYFLVSRLAERKRLEAKDLANQLNALRGSLYVKYVQDSNFKQLNNGRKPPESMINTAIESDAKYFALNDKVNQADYQARTLNWLLKSLEMKASLMQSASANQRQAQQMTGMSRGGTRGI